MARLEDISKSALEALDGGVGVQRAVRSYIKEKLSEAAPVPSIIASFIAGEVAVFKNESEGLIATVSGETVNLYRKKTNNVINDISRICRDMIGYSIVCKKRKGKHEYVAVPATTREPQAAAAPAPAPMSAIPASTVCVGLHFDPTKHVDKPTTVGQLHDIIWNSPPGVKEAFLWTEWDEQKFLNVILGKDGLDIEKFASGLVEEIKRRRAMSAEETRVTV